ncbi:MAG: UDP-3-O-(3-hydroxymyristoyl)glucosamine N-acyltransferase [Rhodospirillales bacterium]|nr:UDP-3-O-(3-hydroxymyristoyl)glucosamine N-acyltransferase [Rhodospirillales bacterium]
MADPRFYERSGPYTLSELVDISGSELLQKEHANDKIEDVAPLNKADSSHISFFDNKKYKNQFEQTNSGAVLVRKSFVDIAPEGTCLFVCDDPYRAYAKVAKAFYPQKHTLSYRANGPLIDPSAKIGVDSIVGPGTYIGPNVVIGDRCEIGPNSTIGRGVTIGDDTIITSNVTLGYCLIGSRVLINPGVRIGQDGFGYAMSPQGHESVPQLGRVIINDDVALGANTTIDRGSGPDTIVGAGTKIDNLVQIAHNVQIGKGCVITAQVGIAGSTKLGDFVVMGGQSGVAGHLEIGSGVQIAAQSGVIGNIAAGQVVGGYPAQPMKSWMKGAAILSMAVKKGRKTLEDK